MIPPQRNVTGKGRLPAVFQPRADCLMMIGGHRQSRVLTKMIIKLTTRKIQFGKVIQMLFRRVRTVPRFVPSITSMTFGNRIGRCVNVMWMREDANLTPERLIVALREYATNRQVGYFQNFHLDLTKIMQMSGIGY